MRAVWAGLAAIWGMAAAAQEAPRLGIELDGLTPVEGACRVTFVARAAMGGDIASLVFEGVAFDAAGGVALLTLLDFGALPDGRPRVRQFDLEGLDCGQVGGLLLNGIEACEGPGAPACLEALAVSSRAAVPLEG